MHLIVIILRAHLAYLNRLTIWLLSRLRTVQWMKQLLLVIKQMVGLHTNHTAVLMVVEMSSTVKLRLCQKA